MRDWNVIMGEKAPALDGGRYRVEGDGEVIQFSRDWDAVKSVAPPGLAHFLLCTQGLRTGLTSVAPPALEEGVEK